MKSLALLLCCLALSACVSSILARKVVSAPNQSGIQPLFGDWPIVARAPDAFSEVWKVRAPGPDAMLEVASVEPGDYAFRFDLRLSYAERSDPRIEHFEAYWRPAAQATRRSARGTVVLLHGYLQDKRFVTPWAVRLAEAGYRCALIDLRGHGQSTGRHVSFGAFEAADVSAVIDDLERRGWDVSRVGLFGVSYGASMAMLTAGRDPRVRAVVAFEPFSSAEKAVPELMRTVFAKQARGISDRQFAKAHIKQARIAGFQWADADIPTALRRSQAPVLLLHGEADVWLSPEHSRELIQSAPQGSQLRLVPRDNHVTLPLQIGPLDDEVIGWFDASVTKP